MAVTAAPAQAQTGAIGLPIQFISASGTVKTESLTDYFIAARPDLADKTLTFKVDGEYTPADQAEAPYQKTAGATWSGLKVNADGTVEVTISGAKAGDYRVVPVRVTDKNNPVTGTYSALLPIVVGTDAVADGTDYPAPGDANVCAVGFGETAKTVPAPTKEGDAWFCISISDNQEADNDGDGLYNSNDPNPNSADGDNDGLTDREEAAIDGLDPNDDDTDGDGIKDGTEIANGTNPTDATDPSSTNDKDKDGLSDKREAELGTDPTKADTDEDGVKDGDEVLTHKTDPLKPDSDGDGFTDGQEVSAGSDPLDINGKPTAGSSTISEQCKATAGGWAVPLLVFVPVAIISNLGVAALKPLNDQIGQVFGNMSADLQQSVGLFSPELAALSSGIDSVQAVKVVSILAAIGMAIGAAVMIKDNCADFFNASSNGDALTGGGLPNLS